MEGQAGGTLSVSRRFSHSAEDVFDAWVDPRIAARWLFRSPGGEPGELRIDARRGGGFSITELRDGEGWEHCGEYLEFERPTLLKFTFWLARFLEQYGKAIVTVEISPLEDGGCELRLTQENTPAEYIEPSTKGWNTLLGNLDTALQN
ncbi:SRPBCC domain-containing protein [bacterium]|nr:SRPBCC domain-containing protein [bacterium]